MRGGPGRPRRARAGGHRSVVPRMRGSGAPSTLASTRSVCPPSRRGC